MTLIGSLFVSVHAAGTCMKSMMPGVTVIHQYVQALSVVGKAAAAVVEIALLEEKERGFRRCGEGHVHLDFNDGYSRS